MPKTRKCRPAGEPDGITQEDLSHNSQPYSTSDSDLLWWSQAVRAVAELATAGQTFTVETVRAAVGNPTNGSLWGGLMSGMHRAGVVEPTGWQRVDRGRWTLLVRTWQGVAE